MFSSHDKEILRPLLAWNAEVAVLPEMAYRKELWRRVNDLERGERMPILVYPENSWREIDETLPLLCRDEFARSLELQLRRLRFGYEALGDDMVVNPYLELSHVFSISGFGVETRRTQLSADGSWVPEPPLHDLQRDLGRLHFRTLQIDEAETARRLEACEDCCKGILPVRLSTCFFWSAGLTANAMDLLGLEAFMLALYDDPDGVHALMRFLMEDMEHLLDELEARRLVTYNSEMFQAGSGGCAYTSALPGFTRPGSGPVTWRDNWGLLESQVTVGVSPEMFGEFIAPYQRRLAERFGLVYCGCCEPVETHFRQVRDFAHLRAISVSPWSDVTRCSELYGNDYAMICKPNPGNVAVDFLEDAIRRELETIVCATRSNSAAIVLKDLHTVGHDLTRYRRWSAIARELIAKHRS